MNLPTPHLGKLNILLANDRLPQETRQKAEQALERYKNWISESKSLTGTNDQDKIIKLVQLFNDYKKFIEYDLIFMDQSDFLYRQKGQLKLDNTILEEFLPL